MMPILHEDNETSIRNYGWGVLKDALSCTVSCEENGAYDLSMIYPMTGYQAEKLLERKLISAAPSLYESRQLFRVYRVARPMDGRIQVYAHHISYDLNNCVVRPFTAKKLSEAISKLRSNIIGDCAFDIAADYDKEGDFAVDKPMTVRAALLSNSAENLASVYGGVWTFDGMRCILKEKVEVNRGVQILYGLNLIDVTQEKNIEEVYTHVYPYWMSTAKNKYYDLEPIQASAITGYKKIYPLDLTSYYEKAPSDASMRKTADEFIRKNDIGKIQVSLTVSYAQLEKCVEYKGSGQSKIILRGNTVEVRYLRLGISAQARVTKTEYNVLAERYNSIQVGDAKERLARTTVRDRNRVTTTNDRAVDASQLASSASDAAADANAAASNASDAAANASTIATNANNAAAAASSAAENASHIATDYIETKPDGGINFGVGDYSYTINNDGLTFHGIRNSEVVWTNDDPKSEFASHTVYFRDGGFAAVAVGFTDNFCGILDDKVVDSDSLQWAIAPTNGRKTRATYTWDYPRVRDFSVGGTWAWFGDGCWLSSKTSFGVPIGVEMHKNQKCCVPQIIIGFL